jgi:FkbM family methyltransferase
LSNTPFKDQTYIREETVDGIGPWVWTKEDTGAWDGPVQDWHTSHKHKYFKHVKNFDVVITAGANHGLHARFYADKFKTVYAFEPDPLNFYCLTYNVQQENVIKIQAALGDENKMITMNTDNKTNTGAYCVDMGAWGGKIPCMKLDNFDFPTVDLIQLDVEGYEIFALRGAALTIAKYRPVIIVENGHIGATADHLEQNLGYKKQEQSVSDTIWVPA